MRGRKQQLLDAYQYRACVPPNPLPMVAGRAGRDSGELLVLREEREPEESPSDLERSRQLRRLELEPDRDAQNFLESRRLLEGCARPGTRVLARSARAKAAALDPA